MYPPRQIAVITSVPQVIMSLMACIIILRVVFNFALQLISESPQWHHVQRACKPVHTFSSACRFHLGIVPGAYIPVTVYNILCCNVPLENSYCNYDMVP